MKIQKGTLVVSLLVLALLGFLYYFAGSALLENPVSTGHLQTIFNEQRAIFTQPISSLGVIDTPTKTFQCIEDHTTYLATYYVCLDSYSYPYNFNPISTTAQASYPVNAAKFDTLLKKNGWVNNRPHDDTTTVAGSDPYLTQNAGVGAEVPFHKNVGAVSCNLEVDFNSLSDEADPGSINVNQFSCQQSVRLFMPHISQEQAGD
jgi:hypothetical protein